MEDGSDAAAGLTLPELVEQRMADLGLRRSDLARGMGYKNISKGCRRVDELRAAPENIDWWLFYGSRLAERLTTRLARGLRVEPGVVEQAIRTTCENARALAWQEYCSSFRPHAVVLCERSVPNPIFAYALMGAQSHVIPMPDGASPVSFAGRALHRLPDLIAGLGNTRGFVVNYTPENAVEFDREGNPVRTLERAERGGSVGFGPRGAAVDLHSPTAILTATPGDQS